MKIGITADQTVTNETPPLFCFIAYSTSRNADTTVNCKIGLGIYTTSSAGWRNNRWACQFTINGIIKNANITVKSQTSGVIGTVPFWPTSTTGGQDAYIKSSKENPYYLYNENISVNPIATSFQVSVRIKDTGFGTGMTGTYSWGTPVSDWGTFTFTIPVDKVTYNKDFYIYKQNIDGSYSTTPTLVGSTGTVDYGSSFNYTWEGLPIYQNITFSGNAYNGDSIIKNAPRTTHDVYINGFLDGSEYDSFEKNKIIYGTCNINFKNNSSPSKTNIITYSGNHRYGEEILINNILNTIGHTFKGFYEGAENIVITSETTIRLIFDENDIYANCNKDSPGDVYIKIDNKWKRALAVYYNKDGNWIKIDG